MTAGATRSDNGTAAGVTRRLTLLEAAQVLGISKEGVRKRVQRGTLRHEKDADGIVHVYISGADRADNGGDAVGDGVGDAGGYAVGDSVGDVQGDHDGHDEALVDALQDRIASLERQLEIRVEELRRKDHIIMSLTQRVPELEAAQDVQEDAPETRQDVVVEDGEEPERRSWWRRVFGG